MSSPNLPENGVDSLSVDVYLMANLHNIFIFGAKFLILCSYQIVSAVVNLMLLFFAQRISSGYLTGFEYTISFASTPYLNDYLIQPLEAQSIPQPFFDTVLIIQEAGFDFIAQQGLIQGNSFFHLFIFLMVSASLNIKKLELSQCCLSTQSTICFRCSTVNNRSSLPLKKCKARQYFRVVRSDLVYLFDTNIVIIIRMKKYSENQMSYTSNSFSRQNIPSYFDQQQSETQGHNFDVQELRALVQGQVYKGLLTIKGQIETKIKQIDKQIRQLKISIEDLKGGNDTPKIIELEQRQFQIAQKVKQILERNEKDRIPMHRNQSRKSIDRSSYLNDSRDRQSSKDRKPIFNKPEINLSTVLFPFSQNEDPPSVLRQDKPFEDNNPYYDPEPIQQLNSLIVNDIHQSPFQVPLNLHIKSEAKRVLDIAPVSYQQRVDYSSQEPTIQGLVKNKNKFLKKKSSTQDLRKQSHFIYDRERFGIIEEESVEESMIRK